MPVRRAGIEIGQVAGGQSKGSHGDVGQAGAGGDDGTPFLDLATAADDAHRGASEQQSRRHTSGDELRQSLRLVLVMRGDEDEEQVRALTQLLHEIAFDPGEGSPEIRIEGNAGSPFHGRKLDISRTTHKE